MVFGCDICQEVCPWNTDAPNPERHPFADAEEHTAPATDGRALAARDLVSWAEELAALADEAFRDRYRGTAFYRPGREGLLRNLAVGLGNSGDETVRPTLERLASDRSELVVEHARWGLEALDARPAR